MKVIDLAQMLDKQTRRIEMLIDTHEKNKKSVFYNAVDDKKRAHDVEIAISAANRLRGALINLLRNENNIRVSAGNR